MTTPMSKKLQTCSACGQKKPLSDFLEWTGTQEQRHGTICSTCRRIEPTERSGGSARFQIDNKAKVQIEQDKKEEFKHTTELEHDEKTKKETKTLEKELSAGEREQLERKRRDEYLNRKTNTFLTTKKPDMQKTLSSLPVATTATDVATAKTLENQRSASKEETQKTSNDLSGTYIDDPHATTVRRSAGSVFSQFRTWIGAGAALNRSLEIYGKKAATIKSNPMSFTKPATPTKPHTEKPFSKEPTVDSIKNNIKRR